MAVTLTLNELAVQLRYSVSDTVPPPHAYIVDLRDWLAAATEWVERRAPNAPEDVMNRAVTSRLLEQLYLKWPFWGRGY